MNKTARVLLVLFALTAALLSAQPSHVGGESILDTKHNLSVGGSGDIVATDEKRVCIFCHTPHHASPVTPLWSREVGGSVYDLYASTTLKAQPGQPTGASRLCLSCHDGTIALGMLYGASEPITFVGGVTTLPLSLASNLQTDLSDDHPISFSYTTSLASENGELRDPGTLPPEIKLEEGHLLQCTACHNPHKNPYGKFQVMDNHSSALCKACHDKTGWSLSSHAISPITSEEGCLNCHMSHGAGGLAWLVKEQIEEENCLPCHSAEGAGPDVKTDFNKFYYHPLEAATGVHDPLEDPMTAAYHVECTDCHNPHRVNSSGAVAPLVNGRLAGVSGVNTSGGLVEEADYEYEICFRCHADNSFVFTAAIPRQIEEVNERLRFDMANPSYHSVAGIGKGLDVPSLRPEYTVTSIIYCTDCHGSDDGTKAGGRGLDGPHGSIYPHLLMSQYEQDDYPLHYTESNYALCFRCHDPGILLSPSSAFPPHNSHVIGHKVSCSICHDPHGVPVADGGSTAGNAHLINFDTRFVAIEGSYDSYDKSCTVSCHNQNPKSY
jgi:predicted CXXCH cytochrome family protein